MDEAAVGLLAARKIWGYSARIRCISSLPILALCKGAHHWGVRWNTVRWPAVLATSVMVCTPVAPVPITATRLLRSAPVPSASHGCGRTGLGSRDAGDGRHRRCREHADGGDQEPCGVAPAVREGDVPAARVFLIVCGGHPALELDVAAQIELVGDVIQIALGLGLRSKGSSQSHSSSSACEKE